MKAHKTILGRRSRRVLLVTTSALGGYLGLAYVVAPLLWRHYEHHPALADAPKTTVTPFGAPGDPLNIGFVGTQTEVIRALTAAYWTPADPITFRTSLGIVRSVLLHEPDPTAPVSTLTLWGRRQDLAFEQQIGNDPRQRHHLRLWQSPEAGEDHRPLWLGSATLDVKVGLSHLTGQITHHIGPDVDKERDLVMTSVDHTKQVLRVYQVSGVGPTINGRNGGGDRYFSDGELTIAVLAVNNEVQAAPPVHLSNPPAVTIKNRLWHWLRSILPAGAPPTDPATEP